MAGAGSKLKPKWLKKLEAGLEAAFSQEDEVLRQPEAYGPPEEIKQGYTKVKDDPSISNPRWRKLVR